MIAAAALLFGVTVPPANVVDQYGPYADPTQPSVGVNATLTPNSDPVVPDDGAAGLWGWTFPALAAVEAGVDTLIGVGTALPSEGPVDPPPAIVGRGEKPIPQKTCACVGENRELVVVPLDNEGNRIFNPDELIYIAEKLDRTDVQQTGGILQDQTTGEIKLPTMGDGVNAVEGEYKWAVRSAITRIVVAKGVHTAEYEVDTDSLTPDTPSGLDGYSTICVNNNGTLLEGVVVVILQGNTVLQSDVTDSKGIARFKLEPGTYTVRLVQPDSTTTEYPLNVE